MSEVAWRALLGAILILTALGGVAGFVPVPVVVAVVFCIPGYLLIAGIFGPTLMPGIERWTLSIVMSMAILTLGAQLLNLTPVAITPLGWLALLAIVAVAVTLPVMRNPAPLNLVWPRLIVTGRDWLMLAAAGSMLFLALAITVSASLQPVDNGFTQMWIEPVKQGARLNVRNQERETVRYRIEIEVNRERTAEQLELQAGRSWSITIPVGRKGGTVNAVLFRYADEVPYRSVRLAR